MTRHRPENEQRDGNPEDGESLFDEVGRWSLLFRFLTYVVSPALSALFVICFIPWAIWVTRGVFRIDHLESALVETTRDVTELSTTHTRQMDDIRTKFEDLPPPEWKARILRLEDFDRQNTADHTQMKIMMQAMLTKLGADATVGQPTFSPTPPPTPGN